MNVGKLAPSHLRKVVRARRRWARFKLEERIGWMIRPWPLYGSAAAELQHLMSALGIEAVVDVGGHVGGFGRLVRKLGHEGTIESFEPASAAVEDLRRVARRDGNWRVHQQALGAEPGALTLDVYEQTQLNSLRRPPSDGSPFDMLPIRSETVEVVRLDDVWNDLDTAGRRVLLKIDAQGYDLEVLRGAERSLAGVTMLVIELSGVPLYSGSPALHEVIGHLAQRSFRLTGLFPIVRHPDDGVQVVDFDATFVRVPVTPRSPT